MGVVFVMVGDLFVLWYVVDFKIFWLFDMFFFVYVLVL